MSRRQAKRARVAAVQSGDPVAAQARAEANQARAQEVRRAQEVTTRRIAAGRPPGGRRRPGRSDALVLAAPARKGQCRWPLAPTPPGRCLTAGKDRAARTVTAHTVRAL